MKQFFLLFLMSFCIILTSCSLRETTSTSPQKISPQEEQLSPESSSQSEELNSNSSTESDSSSDKEVFDLSNKSVENAEYKISFEEIPFSENFPDLAFTPTLFEDKLMLTFSLPLPDTQYNTMLYDLKTQTSTILPFYAPNRFYADKNYYYYLSNRYSGEGITTVMRMNRETLEPETIYSSPEGYQLTCNLSFGDGFLVWAQVLSEGERDEGFEVWGYDIEKEEPFLIDPHCYGSLDYPHEINDGYLCYLSEQPSSKNPYLFIGYSLKERKQVASVATNSEPMSFVFNGTYFAWSDRLNGDQLYLSKKDGNEPFAIAEEAVCPIFIEDRYLLYTLGIPRNKIEIYDLVREEKLSLSRNVDLKEKESFLDFYSTDGAKRAVFSTRIKSANLGENNARIFLLTVTENGE